MPQVEFRKNSCGVGGQDGVWIMTALKTAIAVMTLLIVVGIGLVIWRIATPGPGDARPLAEIGLGLGPNCTIDSATSDKNRLTVVVGGHETCAGIYLVDLATGEIVSIVRP